MPFDPNSYLAEKKSFNPDSYLKEKVSSVQVEEKPQTFLEEFDSPIPLLDDMELPDSSTPDLPKPEPEDAQPQRSPFVQYPSVKPEDIPGTDLGAGLKSIQDQIAGWVTGMVRGAAQTVVGTPEGTIAKVVAPVMGPIAEPMTQMFMKGMEKLIPGTTQQLSNLVEGKTTQDIRKKLAQPTDIEIKAQQDFEQNATEALQAYGLPVQIAYKAAGMAWRMAGTVLLAEATMGKGTAPGSATRIGEQAGVGMTPVEKIASTIKAATIKAGAKFAGLMYTITPGTPEEKTKAAVVGFAFSATPLIASGARTDGLAKLFTAAMNVGVSAVSGAYNDTVEQAQAIATARREDWNKLDTATKAKYWAASAIPQAVADLTMALGAKSPKAAEKLLRDKTIKAVMLMTGNDFMGEKIPEGTTPPLIKTTDKSAIPPDATTVTTITVDGKTTYEYRMKNIEPTSGLNPEQLTQKANDLLDRQGTQAQRPEAAAEGAKELQSRTGESLRQGTTATPEGVTQATTPATGVSDLRQSLAEAKTHDIANKVIDIAAERIQNWNDLRKLYAEQVKEGKIANPETNPTKATVVQALKDNWQPVAPLAPVDVAKVEPTLPGYMRKWGNAPKTSVTRLEEHVNRVKETIDKSVLSTQSKMGYQPKPEESTKAQMLKDGLDKAINHLKTLEFKPEQFDEIVDGMTKGKNKVEGIGPSAGEILKIAWASETPEQAMSMINTARANRGTSVISDIGTAVRGGEPLPEKKPFALSKQSRDELFDAMPSKIKESENGLAAIEAAINGMSFELPQDATARNNVKRTVVKNAYEIRKAMDGGRLERDMSWESAKAHLRLLDSARYWMNNIYQRTGDFKFLKNDNLAEKLAVQKEYESQVEFDRVLDQEKVPYDLRYHVSNNKELNGAIADVLGLNPLIEKNKPLIEKANKMIDKDERAGDVKKLIDTIRHISQNSTAAEVRSLQIIKWTEFWKKNGQKIIEGEAGKGDKLTLRGLQNKEKELLPSYINEKTGEIENISREQAQEAMRIYEADGVNALLNYEYGQNYGTRKYYWMTDFNPAGEFSIDSVSGKEMFDLDAMLGQKISTPVSTGTTEHRTQADINPETGMSRMKKDTSVYSAWFKHMRDLKVQLHTYDLVKDLGKTLNDHIASGKLHPEEAKMYGLRLKNMWGKTQDIPTSTKLLLAANTLFWKTYFVSIARMAWFGGRNLFQGSPFGLINSQYKVGDVAQAYPMFVAKMFDKNSTVRAAFDTDFRQRINQSKSFFNERMMLSAPGERQYAGRLMDVMQMMAGATDTGARLFVYGPGYVIAEKYAGRLAEGKITQGQFEDGLMFDSMSAGDRMIVRDMMEGAKDANGKFARAGLEPIIREVAKIKNSNVNFLYRTTERSMIEQERANTPLTGIMSFARGSVENLYQQSIRPMAEGLDMLMKTGDIGNIKPIQQGMRNLLKTVVAYAASSTFMSYILGEKRDYDSVNVKETQPGYGLLSSMSWGPFSPGASRVYELGKNLFDLASDVSILATADTASFKRALYKDGSRLANTLIYMTPVLSDLANLAEATNNKAMVNNVDALKYWFHDIWKGKALKGVEAGRVDDLSKLQLESFLHFAFGTVEFHDKRNIWQRFGDSTVVGEAQQIGTDVKNAKNRVKSFR